MARRLKLIVSLSTLALGATAITACGGEGEGAEGEAASAAHGAGHAEGESEGAGAAVAGAESEGTAIAGADDDKAAYLAGLIMARGHLRAGTALYAANERAAALAHLQHPQAEIMTELAPAFAAYGAQSIAPALSALAEAGAANAAPAEVDARKAAAFSAIAAAESAAGASVKEQLLAVARVLTTAGDEYSVGVVDGALANAHEYHDAYGFIAEAGAHLARMSGANPAEQTAIEAARAQAALAAAAAPSVAAVNGGFKPASAIYGAAARIEIAANAL